MIKKILLSAAVVVIGLGVYMKIPSSPLRSEYKKKLAGVRGKLEKKSGIFTEEDFSQLPKPLKEYFIRCGYLGKDKVEEVIMHFEDVEFKMSRDKPSLKIDYTLHDFGQSSERLAFIDTSLYGIPFQGLDEYISGSGGMKGVLGKHIKLFNVKGRNMDRGGLVTYLAESIMHPSLAINQEIEFYLEGELSVRAVIKKGDMNEEGIITFDDNFMVTSFTAKRYNSDSDSYEDWAAELSQYKEVNGVIVPTSMIGKWILEDGDFVYFNGENMNITMN